tara:strand:+ start:274 stop:621 length:348 start_codon:yes stop_codon:yes gene_type:complete
MTWKSVLKNIEMDETVSCCEEARLKIVRWFEEHAGKTSDRGLKASLFQTASDLSEETCEELEASIERFQDMWDLERSSLFDDTKLNEIMDEWDMCDSLATQRMNNEKRSVKIHRK